MSDLRPLYCVYCGQTLLSDDMEKCSGCGKVGGIADARDQAAVAALIAQKPPRYRPGPAAPTGGAEASPLGQAFSAYRSVRAVIRAVAWVVGGAFCIGMGIWLLTSPMMRTDPRKFTLNDAMPGVTAIFVGVVLFALAFLSLFLRRRPQPKGGDKADQPDQPA